MSEISVVNESTESRALAFRSTIEGNDFQSRLATAKAVNSSTPLDEVLGKPFTLANAVIHEVEMTSEETGELTVQPRVILIDSEGNARHAISAPLARDLSMILEMLGSPSSWDEPVKMVVNREGTGTRKYFTLKFAK